MYFATLFLFKGKHRGGKGSMVENNTTLPLGKIVQMPPLLGWQGWSAQEGSHRVAQSIAAAGGRKHERVDGTKL